ncbi:Hypothetical predicted protein [Podarcis lilfordi]|uniref:Uncharacterized protein n=1 Tax=Podarcis lilfordi TaxID=74358 RepID=A0AA35KMN3_9SAUR|nr:Hypothetical predicted protein [Podarcis lilfordi]
MPTWEGLKPPHRDPNTDPEPRLNRHRRSDVPVEEEELPSLHLLALRLERQLLCCLPPDEGTLDTKRSFSEDWMLSASLEGANQTCTELKTCEELGWEEDPPHTHTVQAEALNSQAPGVPTANEAVQTGRPTASWYP